MLLSLAVTAEAAARQESSARQLSVSPTAEVATRQCTESDLYAGWPRVHHDPLYASARPNPLESLLGCAVVDLEHASLSQDEILTLAREVATNGTVVAGLTRLLACEWAPLGINVNAVAPGYVVTNNTEALREDPVRYKAILDRIPAGHWAQPSDIAGAVVYLASDAANYVHGVVLPVDGGWLAR